MGLGSSLGFRSRRRRREIADAIAAEHTLAPRPRSLGALARQVAALEADRTRPRAGASLRGRSARDAAAGR